VPTVGSGDGDDVDHVECKWVVVERKFCMRCQVAGVVYYITTDRERDLYNLPSNISVLLISPVQLYFDLFRLRCFAWLPDYKERFSDTLWPNPPRF
jgi:hypothetical protein